MRDDYLLRVILRPRENTASRSHTIELVRGNAALRRGNREIIIGRIVQADGSSLAVDAFKAFPAAIGAADIRARGWWGDYVIVRATTQGVEFERDPGGAIPCYWLHHDNTVYIGSNAPRLFAAAGITPHVDFGIVESLLRFPDRRSERTAIERLHELLPGMRANVSAGGQCRTIVDWTPRPFCSPAPSRDRAAHASGLVDAAIASVRGTGQTVAHPIVQLSGGLDSAITAAAADACGRNLPGVNVTTSTPEGDERRFARAVASALSMPLAEVEMNAARIDLSLPRAPGLPRPTRRLFARDMDVQVERIARAHGHDAIISGGGGDSVFAFLAPGFAAADQIANRHLSGIGRVLRDEAHIRRTSSIAILGKAIRFLLARQEWYRDDRFLHTAAADRCPPPHPWMDAVRGLPPGKQAHVAALVAIHAYVDAFEDDFLPRIFPLLAQPMIEYCLSIPSIEWVRGGRNRSLARAAFETRLPASILNRRGKGSYEGFAASLFEQNRALAREMLLGGALAARNILDRAALECWFEQGRSPSGSRMLTLIEAESWCRWWLSRSASDVTRLDPATGASAPLEPHPLE